MPQRSPLLAAILWAGLAAGLTAPLLPVPAEASAIDFAVSDDSVRVGEVFRIQAIARDLFAGLPLGEELVGFGFDYALHPDAILGILGLAVTPMLADPYTDISPLGGALVGAVAGSSPVVNGGSPVDLVLASFSVEARAVGRAELSVSALLGNPDQGLRFLLDPAGDRGFDGSVQVLVQAAPVPLPATALLVAAGLAGLAGRARPRS